MAEAGGSDPAVPGGDLDLRLDRIEAAVAAGDTDLRTLGFWRIVALVKADRIMVDRYADRLGSIDATAFRRAVRPRFPVWVGNAALFVGAAVGGVLIGIAGKIEDEVWKGLLVILAGLDWAVAVHCPTHWLFGRFIDVRFSAYVLRGVPPYPGLKTDYATYLRADPGSRAWMHASGAIATKLAPFLALIFVPIVEAPAWAAIVLAGVGVLQIITDVAFSTKKSDWKRFSRERRVALARRDV
jgi:hypothetical protein